MQARQRVRHSSRCFSSTCFTEITISVSKPIAPMAGASGVLEVRFKENRSSPIQIPYRTSRKFNEPAAIGSRSGIIMTPRVPINNPPD
jgi:hypothetical protein